MAKKLTEKNPASIGLVEMCPFHSTHDGRVSNFDLIVYEDFLTPLLCENLTSVVQGGDSMPAFPILKRVMRRPKIPWPQYRLGVVTTKLASK